MGVLSKVLQTKKELEVKGVHETKTINECLQPINECASAMPFLPLKEVIEQKSSEPAGKSAMPNAGRKNLFGK